MVFLAGGSIPYYADVIAWSPDYYRSYPSKFNDGMAIWDLNIPVLIHVQRNDCFYMQPPVTGQGKRSLSSSFTFHFIGVWN